jgi:DNA-directed RNA polymerase subunit RPC12/RpoP
MSNPRSPQRPGSGHTSSRPGIGGGGASPASPLKLLVAGVDSDTRGLVESAVRHALGSRIVSESWTVSLVRIGNKWSVTLDGPEPRFRNLSFTSSQERLSTAIREAIGAPGVGGGTGSPVGSPVGSVAPHSALHSTPSAGEAHVEHVCERCQQRFVVRYEHRPGETKVMAAVACPYCWELNHLEIGEWAASGKDYRAEKA